MTNMTDVAEMQPVEVQTIDDTETAAVFKRIAAVFGGVIPNFHRLLARNPAVLDAFDNAYIALNDGVLSAAERNLIAVEVGRFAECHYCTAAHCVLLRENGLDETAYHEVVVGMPLSNSRLGCIQQVAQSMMHTHGKLNEAQRKKFIEDGISVSELIEIAAIIGLFTWATAVANMANLELDDAFEEMLPDEFKL